MSCTFLISLLSFFRSRCRPSPHSTQTCSNAVVTHLSRKAFEDSTQALCQVPSPCPVHYPTFNSHSSDATSANQRQSLCHSLSALVAIAAENSLLFMAYGATQRLVSRVAKVEEEQLGVLGYGLAGGLALSFHLPPKSNGCFDPDFNSHPRRRPGCILAVPGHLPH